MPKKSDLFLGVVKALKVSPPQFDNEGAEKRRAMISVTIETPLDGDLLRHLGRMASGGSAVDVMIGERQRVLDFEESPA